MHVFGLWSDGVTRGLEQEKRYMCVSRLGRVELWLGLIEGWQKSPDDVSGHGPRYYHGWPGDWGRKPTEHLMIYAQLSSSETSCDRPAFVHRKKPGAR